MIRDLLNMTKERTKKGKRMFGHKKQTKRRKIEMRTFITPREKIR